MHGPLTAWILRGPAYGFAVGARYESAIETEQTQDTERTVWPVIIGYAETVRLLAAWCELRQAFRHFRTDRILAAEFLDENYGCRPSALRTRWKRQMESERGVRLS